MKHAICIFLSLFFAAAAAFAADGALRLGTVVIDAGHGGKDSGAISKDGKTFEKTLVLDIATKLSDRISKAFPEVKVVLTRSTDEFVELRERADIANKAGANLFISLHINSNAKSTPNGYSVHILGQSSQKNRDLFAYNMDVVKRENSVILLEDDYKTNYQGFDPSDPESYIFMQLMQNAYLEQSLLLASIISEKLKGGPIKADRGISQNPFYVLWRTAMPAVLVEMGFISNAEDVEKLRQESSRGEIADRLFEAFKDYKELYDSSLDIGSGRKDGSAPGGKEASGSGAKEPSVQQQPAPEKPSAQGGEVLYGTQIFATSRLLDEGDSRFLGYKPEIIRIQSLYKYIIGTSSSEAEARRLNEKIKKEYPASFMVRLSDGTAERFK